MARAPRSPIDQALDAQQLAHRVRVEREARYVPALGLDRDGNPPLDALARAEIESRARFSPRRLRWPEVQRLDAEVARLDTRHQQVLEEMALAGQAAAAAPAVDAEALAFWIADGERGARPTPTLPAAQRRVAELELEERAVSGLASAAVAKKARYLERHRPRLAKLAREAVEVERDRARRLIDELAEARDAIAEARAVETWVLTFGSEAAIRPADTRPLVGGLAAPLARAGISTRVEASAVLGVLREDVDWVASAATPDQRALLDGDGRPDLAREAVWRDTSEGEAARREEAERQREQYVQHWGEPPPW